MMSTHVEVLRIPVSTPIDDTIASSRPLVESIVESRSLDPFTSEQISGLVHQLFFPSSGKLRKQIVFSAVDENVDVGGICTLVAESLAERVGDAVAVVDAHACSRDIATNTAVKRPPERIGFRAMRAMSRQMSGNLWAVPGPVFWGNDSHAGSPAWVRERLGELRSEFDYSVIHAPAAGVYSGTCLLGQVSDGLVLVIEADYTRRSTAQKAKERLHMANVKTLGVVLSGRTFPIPESIYRKL